VNSSAILATAQWTPAWWQLRDDACSWTCWDKCEYTGSSTKRMGNSVQPLKRPTQVPPIPTAQWISFPLWQFVFEFPTAVRGGAESLIKGLPQNGGRLDFSKSFVPLYSIKALRMYLISAVSTSLDSTFKGSLIIDIPLQAFSFSPGGSLNIPQGPFYRKFEWIRNFMFKT
jgi:hypothetical protein